MPLDEPPWWYGPAGDVRARLLGPLAGLYGLLSERHAARAPAYRASVPVICIGNFTAGGTGKTPLSLLVAEMLGARGLTAAFLTRGYGGRQKGPAWVEPSIATARDVGDEPMLLARVAPTLISRDRAAGARLVEVRTPPVDVIVMDDGLQNPGLHKDLRIAVVDGRRGVGNGRVMPAGPLRAGLAFQLARVDAIVVSHSGEPAGGESAVGEIVARLRGSFPGPVLAAGVGPRGDTGWLRGQPLLAFAGIANPQRFYDLLALLGADVVETVSFRDHHAFSEDDAQRLLARARARGAALVTTEKDHVRLVGGAGALAELAMAARPLAIRIAFDERDALRLGALLDGVCRKRPTSAPAAP